MWWQFLIAGTTCCLIPLGLIIITTIIHRRVKFFLLFSQISLIFFNPVDSGALQLNNDNVDMTLGRCKQLYKRGCKQLQAKCSRQFSTQFWFFLCSSLKMKIYENTKTCFVVCESHKNAQNFFRCCNRPTFTRFCFRRQRACHHQFLRRLVSIQQYAAADFWRGSGKGERSFPRTGQGGFRKGQLWHWDDDCLEVSHLKVPDAQNYQERGSDEEGISRSKNSWSVCWVSLMGDCWGDFVNFVTWKNSMVLISQFCYFNNVSCKFHETLTDYFLWNFNNSHKILIWRYLKIVPDLL